MKDTELKDKLVSQGFSDPDIQQARTLLAMPEMRLLVRWLREQEQEALAGLLRSSPERVLQDQGRAAMVNKLVDQLETSIEIIREETDG